MEDEFYKIVGISWPLWGYAIICIFINIHGLNIYFWISFIPALLVMLVGTKLQHVVSVLALEVAEPRGRSTEAQVKPRDDLFWFGKPEILLLLIQFISFQNAFEMATFLWSLWGLKHQPCFMNNHFMIVIRLTSGVLVQFWCSYSTVPLNILVTQMGSRCKKAIIAENVRESLHSWCKRVKDRSKRDSLLSVTTRSTCSLELAVDEREETVTVGSGTLSPCYSSNSLDKLDAAVPSIEQPAVETSTLHGDVYSFSIPEYPLANGSSEPQHGDVGDILEDGEEMGAQTLFDLFQKT